MYRNINFITMEKLTSSDGGLYFSYFVWAVCVQHVLSHTSIRLPYHDNSIYSVQTKDPLWYISLYVIDPSTGWSKS